MPGPLHDHSRKSVGPRPDPNGNPRKPNAKQAKRLAMRQSLAQKPSNKYANGYHVPGSQNRNK